ncbi:hypothetical protein [Pseudomonas lundensis]
MQQPAVHQQRVRAGARATVLALANAGFFTLEHNRRLFLSAGFMDA